MHNPYDFSGGAQPPPANSKLAEQAPTRWIGSVTDGHSAVSWPVDVSLQADGIALTRPGTESASAVWSFADIATAEPLRHTSVDVLITSASATRMSLLVRDARFAAEIGRRAPHTTLKAHRLAGLRVGAPFGVVALALTALVYGFDLSPTKAVARLMPDTARERLGKRVLASLPISEANRRTCDEPVGRAAVEALVKRLLPDTKDNARKVLVLNWPIVNAFAVPGGQVILTRGIIERAAGPDEIAGVLAHEIGHSLQLHPEAGLVRSVGFWALIQMVFTGTPGALGNIGSSLVQLAHNRGFEREADAIALKLLRDAKISPKAFAGFFKREAGKPSSTPESSRGPLGLPNDVFETHPSSPERIRTIESVPDYPSTPALTAEQWQAMRSMCRGAATTAPQPANTAPPPPLNLDEQIRTANQRILRSPTADNIWMRGEILVEAKRYVDAIADFDKAIAMGPPSPSFHFSRANARMGMRSFEEAILDYSQALSLNSTFAAALAGRANAHKELGRADAAMRDYTAALVINPRYFGALYGRGILHAEAGRWTAAESDFTSAIANNRSHAMAFVRRAQTFEKLAQRDKAIADYRDGLRGAPGSPDAAEAFRLARARLKDLGVPEK